MCYYETFCFHRIEIIAILAGMLLPALNTAKKTARSISCISNMKQIGVGTVLYRSDYSGFFPQGSQNTTADLGNYTSWTHRVGMYLIPGAGMKEMVTYVNHSKLGSSLENARIANRKLASFICPEAQDFYWTTSVGSHVAGNYGTNVCLLGQDTLSIPEYKWAKKETLVRRPSAVGQCWDAEWSVWGGGPLVYTRRHVYSAALKLDNGASVSTRHGRKTANVLYADGHALSVKPSPALPIEFSGSGTSLDEYLLKTN